jgi:hypothetical protein
LGKSVMDGTVEFSDVMNQIFGEDDEL